MDKLVENTEKIYAPKSLFSDSYKAYDIPFTIGDIRSLNIIKLSTSFRLYALYIPEGNNEDIYDFYVGYYFPLYYDENKSYEYTFKKDILLFDLRDYANPSVQITSKGPMLSNMMNYVETDDNYCADGYIYRDRYERGFQVHLFQRNSISAYRALISYSDVEKQRIKAEQKKYGGYPFEESDNEMVNKNIIS